MSAQYGAVPAIFWQLPWIFHYCGKQEMTFEGFTICLMYVFIHIPFNTVLKGSEKIHNDFRKKRAVIIVFGLFLSFYLQHTD